MTGLLEPSMWDYQVKVETKEATVWLGRVDASDQRPSLLPNLAWQAAFASLRSEHFRPATPLKSPTHDDAPRADIDVPGSISAIPSCHSLPPTLGLCVRVQRHGARDGAMWGLGCSGFVESLEA
ncbi:hypothetical protein DFH06DRAFT_1151339 [Mycena polygramma]|nr:hypothetical protein DFH06DRAFT_1153123 [Mycena polygramma]KAJ7604159.1 hypothetical protein DFH06DRAFT_1151339 [Mycena polygramma]